jgi:hypothetical protein
MAKKIYKRLFKGSSLEHVHAEIGQRGGVVLRVDQTGDETTAYYEADERVTQSQSKSAASYEERVVSIKEVTKT